MDGLYYLGVLNLFLTTVALLAVAALWRREGSPRFNVLPKLKSLKPKKLNSALVPSSMLPRLLLTKTQDGTTLLSSALPRAMPQPPDASVDQAETDLGLGRDVDFGTALIRRSRK